MKRSEAWRDAERTGGGGGAQINIPACTRGSVFAELDRAGNGIRGIPDATLLNMYAGGLQYRSFASVSECRQSCRHILWSAIRFLSG